MATRECHGDKMMAKIQAVYFDAVGTLLFPDPPAEEVYVAVGRAHGLTVQVPEVRQRLRKAFAEQEEVDRQHGWKVDALREEQRWRTIVQNCLPLSNPHQAEAVFRILFEHFARPQAWRLNDEVRPVLEMLYQRGLTCGIASNYDARLRSVVAGIPELARLKERLVISAEVGYRKPSAVFFAAIAAQAGCPPSEVLYVGDDPILDYQGALAAGLQALWYQPQKKTEAAFPLRSPLQPTQNQTARIDEPAIQRLSQILELALP
jgi:putative hydrolase of the HAD superfamily